MVDDPKQLLREFKEEFHIMPAGYGDRKEEEKGGEAETLGQKKPKAGKSLHIPVLIILFILLFLRK